MAVGSLDLGKAISAGRGTLVGHLGVRFPAGVLFPALVALLWFHSSQKARFSVQVCRFPCWLLFFDSRSSQQKTTPRSRFQHPALITSLCNSRSSWKQTTPGPGSSAGCPSLARAPVRKTASRSRPNSQRWLLFLTHVPARKRQLPGPSSGFQRCLFLSDPGSSQKRPLSGSRPQPPALVAFSGSRPARPPPGRGSQPPASGNPPDSRSSQKQTTPGPGSSIGCPSLARAPVRKRRPPGPRLRHPAAGHSSPARGPSQEQTTPGPRLQLPPLATRL
jgi:hypothetical protein